MTNWTAWGPARPVALGEHLVVLDRAIAAAHEAAHEPAELSELLAERADVEYRMGRWERCRTTLSDAMRMAAVGSGTVGDLHVQFARLAASEGHRTTADFHLCEARRIALDRGDPTMLRAADAVEASIALLDGDFGWCLRLLDPRCLAMSGRVVVEEQQSVGSDLSLLVSALIGLGHRTAAEHFIAEPIGCGNPTPWFEAMSRRCAALVSGDPLLAQESADRFDTIGAPFEAARSMLVAGQIAHTTQRLSFDVRLAAKGALRVFCALGARPWIAAGTALLDEQQTYQGPTPGRVLHLPTVLTVRERAILDVVGTGASNRIVGEKLYISVKTVEAHLTQIYKKLGVETRSQLLAALATTQVVRIAAPVVLPLTG